MRSGRHYRGRSAGIEPPIELRFVDLFMILVTTLIFVAVLLSIISSFLGVDRPREAPRILTRSLPAALEGRPYEVMLAAGNGDGALRWHLVEGELPRGLELTPDGRLAGTPSSAGGVEFRVAVEGHQMQSEAVRLALSVAPRKANADRGSDFHVVAPKVSLPDAVSKEVYNFKLKPVGGRPPYRWALAEGALPEGIDWSPEGVLRGVPGKTKEAKPFSFSMKVNDTLGRELEQKFVLQVLPPAKSWLRRTLERGFTILLYLLWMYILWKGGPGLQQFFEQWKRRRRRRALGL